MIHFLLDAVEFSMGLQQFDQLPHAGAHLPTLNFFLLFSTYSHTGILAQPNRIVKSLGDLVHSLVGSFLRFFVLAYLGYVLGGKQKSITERTKKRGHEAFRFATFPHK